MWNRPCFNEAPIRESGKLPPDLDDALNQLAASMRPRFANRGSYGRVIRECRRTTCFNEAPIRESGKSHTGDRTMFQPVASMRPRFANRGSTERWAQAAANAAGFNEAPIRESGKLWVLGPQ